MTALEDWLTTEIVEDMLGISKRTLQTLRTQRKIGFCKVGGRCYYKRSDIELLMENCYVEAEQLRK